MWADIGRSLAAERIFLALAFSPGDIRMARPQSEVSRRGTGINRMDTPAFFKCFSADKT
jgi:hypothetical protein